MAQQQQIGVCLVRVQPQSASLVITIIENPDISSRHGETTRSFSDVTAALDQLIDCTRANRAKGPAGNHGSRLRAELAKKGQKLPLLGDDDATADRNYIKEFVLARNRELGRRYGVEYAEAFHYIGPGRPSPVEDYVRKNAVPLK